MTLKNMDTGKVLADDKTRRALPVAWSALLPA